MKNGNTRRQFVVGSASVATAALAATGATASLHDDAAILEKAAEHARLRAQANALQPELERLEDAAEKNYPDATLPIVTPLDVMFFSNRVYTKLRGMNADILRAGLRWEWYQISALDHQFIVPMFSDPDWNSIPVKAEVPEVQARANAWYRLPRTFTTRGKRRKRPQATPRFGKNAV